MAVDYALIEDIDTDKIEPIAIVEKAPTKPRARPKPPTKDPTFLGDDGTECNILLMLFVVGTVYIMTSR